MGLLPMNDSELYPHQKHYDTLLEKYKCVFVEKARQIGGTAYGIHKSVQVANEKANSNILILTANQSMIEYIHKLIISQYKYNKTNHQGLTNVIFDNGSTINISSYKQYYNKFKEQNDLIYNFVFLDEPNFNYVANTKLESEINQNYKCQVFAIGTGTSNREYDNLIINANYKIIERTPWYSIQNEKYLKHIDYIIGDLSKEAFNVQYRCKSPF